MKKYIVAVVLMVSLSLGQVMGPRVSEAKNYIMSLFVYLNDEAGSPVSMIQDVRISLWSYGQLEDGDITPEGSLEVNALNYAGYQTVISLTPDSQGRGRIALGELLEFPQLLPTNQFLMLEYKDQGAPDTAYRLYDAADDVYRVGTTLNRIPLIENGPSIFQGIYNNPGTGKDSWILGGDDSGQNIELVFGKLLAEKIFWNVSDGRFEVTDDLLVHGGFRINTDALVVNGTTGKIGIGTNVPDTTLHIDGSLSIKRVGIADVDYTVQDDDYLVAYTSITTGRTIHIPDSLCTPGRIIIAKDESGDAGSSKAIILDPEGATMINSSNTRKIQSRYGAKAVYCADGQWYTY